MGTNYYSSGKKIPKVKESLSDKINDEFTFEFTDVKEAVQKIIKPIESELKIAKKHNTSISQTVQLLLNQIIKNINKEFGKKLI